MGVRMFQLGKITDDFRPDQFESMSVFERTVVKMARTFKRVIAPRCSFTNRIVALKAEERSLATGFVWSPEPADGVILDDAGEVAVIFNADCPIVSVFDEERNRLAVLHVGLKSIFSPEHKEGHIIRRLFDDYDFPREEVKVTVNYGIGPCCFAPSRIPKGIPLHTAVKGPRRGRSSIDLKSLIRQEFILSGVKPELIGVDPECTACKDRLSDDDPNGKYHSYCWDGKKRAGKNAAFVSLEEKRK